MGRMIDILRSADRRPAAGPVADRPAPAEPELKLTAPMVVELPALAEPPIEDDDTVPFIEVGGSPERTLRLVSAPPDAIQSIHLPPPPTSPRGIREPEAISSMPVREAGPGGLSSSAPNLFTIRFQPIQAARIGGRSPVAELIAFHKPDHAISLQYKSLAADIMRQLPGSTPRVLVFAGSTAGAGASTVLLNLAITLARQDAKVTVADAHLARPALADRLGLPGSPGLREVLAGQKPLAWCLQETAHPNLMVLPAGETGEPRDDADLGAILDLLRGRSDCVLIDAGPWGEAPLAAGLAAGSDAVYLVLPEDAASTSDTLSLQEVILQETGRLRGCVLTKK